VTYDGKDNTNVRPE